MTATVVLWQEVGDQRSSHGEALSGAIGLDEAIRRSPSPAEPTGVVLERARLELATE